MVVFALLALAALVTALASWPLARMQGRTPWGWALASLVLCGLPLVWLLIVGLFGAPAAGGRSAFGFPSFASNAGRRCCEAQNFVEVADFDSARGFDLALGKCGHCGAWLMSVYWGGSLNYVMLPEEKAKEFLALEGTPALRRMLRDWVN